MHLVGKISFISQALPHTHSLTRPINSRTGNPEFVLGSPCVRSRQYPVLMAAMKQPGHHGTRPEWSK